jgi:hypothetical protein
MLSGGREGTLPSGCCESRRLTMSGDPVAPEPKSESLIGPIGEGSPPATTPSKPYTRFETFVPTSYELPLDLQAAVLAPGESVASWLGPVNKLGGSDVSSHYTRTGWSRRTMVEHDRDAVNTLLFTSYQVIGLMLGPDDLQNLQGSGPVKELANEAVEHWQWYREGGQAKGVQFGSLNLNHWKDMVDALNAQPLEAALSNHLNCGLPYDRVQSVEVKSRFINPGLTIRLTDGAYLRYGTFGKRSQLADVASYLRSYVKVQ